MHSLLSYNLAIARSNTDIVVNAVIVLFITDIDEQFFDVLVVISPQWVETLRYSSDSHTSSRSIEKEDKGFGSDHSGDKQFLQFPLRPSRQEMAKQIEYLKALLQVVEDNEDISDVNSDIGESSTWAYI
jgi:hypothetical protein